MIYEPGVTGAGRGGNGAKIPEKRMAYFLIDRNGVRRGEWSRGAPDPVRRRLPRHSLSCKDGLP